MGIWWQSLCTGLVSLVIAATVGGLSLAFHQPWLFPSLGPIIFIHIVTPDQDSARHWNTLVGHAIGVAAAYLSLFLFGALYAPPAMDAGHIAFGRMAASALAVALTVSGQIATRASHAPAAATTLLITLGSFRSDVATVIVLAIGIGLTTLLCDCGRLVLKVFRGVRSPP